MSQKQLAEKVGVKVTAISRYERGKQTPSLRTTIKMMKVLECQFEALIEERD
jgi:DNA-binding XRE family transcriptional regulator